MTKEQMEQIVSENMKKIYLYCVRRLGNAADAEDVASDIMLELLRSYSEVRDDAAVHSYMWSVAGNLCRSFWRKAARRTTTEIPEDYAGAFMITPEEQLIHEEELLTLRRELSLLSEKYRKVMIAHYIQQKTCEEIAGETGLTVTNVKQYLFEGRKKVRKGMDMQREYGVYSYAPEKFTMNFWGDGGEGYWSLFDRKLPGSIMLSVYDAPKTLEELSMEVGVSMPYLEDEVERLLKYEVLVKQGNKYRSGIVIYDNAFLNEVKTAARKALTENIDAIHAMVKRGIAILKESDFTCYKDDENVRGWFVLMLILWEAAQNSESKMQLPLTFPLLANGSRGYVMGERGEHEVEVSGFYGMYSLNHGFLRAMNFNRLSNRVVNPFERGVRDVLLACEERRSEMAEWETLSDMIENKIVHIEDGKICPNYCEISEKYYIDLMEKLAAEIDSMADLSAKLREHAAQTLAASTPKDIAHAAEIGSIVSMWSILENIVPIALESGLLTKGTEEQNVTTFYIRR